MQIRFLLTGTKAIIALLTIVGAEQVLALNIELARSEYLPGELLEITCKWPKEPPRKSGLVTLIPYKAGLLGKARERYVPSTYFIYSSKFGQPDCVKLRAPWAEGKYTLEVIADTTPKTPAAQIEVVVGELPAADILRYNGLASRTAAGKLYLEYTLTFTNDRCYPYADFGGAEGRDVVVFALERTTGAIASVNRYVARGNFKCVKDCQKPPIKHACLPSGTHRHFMPVPKNPGTWDLTFGLSLKPGEKCISQCVSVPSDKNEEPPVKFRVIDQKPALTPVPAKKIYATGLRNDAKELDLSRQVDQSFYLWVEYAEDNPFLSDQINVTLPVTGDTLTPIRVHRVDGSFRLFRSDRLDSKKFLIPAKAD